jgi:PTH1 family peptidyl-tRNA hydrolase
MKIIVGLGNPGQEYETTRHNAGRIILEAIRKNFLGENWEYNKIYDALISEIKIGKEKVMLIEPETFMNKSGISIKKLVTNKKKAGDMIVIYDDLDLPVGKIKISFNKSSGGHKGLESIIKQIKTLEFPRIRIGIDKGKDPEKHILGSFKDDEVKTLKKLGKKICKALEVLVKDGWEKSASLYSNLEV